MKIKEMRAYMIAAFALSELSYCKRRQVGCVIVTPDRLVVPGYNGTPPGDENCCEDETGKTKPQVIHAERNAVVKLAKSTISSEGSIVFITCSPCHDCAVLLDAAGIKEVYYSEVYESSSEKNQGISGIEYLKNRGISTTYFPIKEQ